MTSTSHHEPNGTSVKQILGHLLEEQKEMRRTLNEIAPTLAVVNSQLSTLTKEMEERKSAAASLQESMNLMKVESAREATRNGVKWGIFSVIASVTVTLVAAFSAMAGYMQ